MTEGQEKVQKALEDLIRLASRHKVAIAGFAFAADPPMISGFSNCTDSKKIELYDMLIKMCDEKVKQGQVIETIVEEVN